jgi:hypothetical protein
MRTEKLPLKYRRLIPAAAFAACSATSSSLDLADSSEFKQ